jgi:hypothetical protein
MHGMNNFGLISRMITDWAYPADRHREIETGHCELALGSDRRHGAQPERREGRHRGGHGRVPASLDFASNFNWGPLAELNLEWGPWPAQIGLKGPVWIDIRPRNGLEIARPGRHSRRRDEARFATFGLSNTAFQSIRIVP